MITFKEARSFLGRFVDGGQCDPGALSARLYEAETRLVHVAGGRGAVRPMRFCCVKDCITLPHNVERIRRWAPHGCPGTIQTMYYEFLEGGFGVNNWSPANKLIDMGSHYATYQEMAEPLQLLAWAECEEDPEARLTLAGQDGFGRVLVTEDGPGETIEIRSGGSWRDPPRYTQHTFRTVSSILKPRTKGYVHLFGYEPVSMQYVQLGMYGPSEHVPGFRRYKIPQCHCGYVDALVQMRVLPLEFDNDVLVIQNLPALKKMLQAITIEDAGDMAIAREHEARAIKMIEDDQLWIDDVVPEIQNDLHRYRAMPDDVM